METMARVVVLVFKDETVAEEFAKTVLQNHEALGGLYVDATSYPCEVLAVLKPSTLAKGFSYELPQGEDGIYRG
jgi:hypothetical protein